MSVLLRVCCHTDSLRQQQEEEEELHAGFQRRSTTTWTQNRVRNTGSALQPEKSPQSDTKTLQFYRTNRKLETRRVEKRAGEPGGFVSKCFRQKKKKSSDLREVSTTVRCSVCVGPSGCCSASLRFSPLGSSRTTSLFAEQEEPPRRELVSPSDGSKVHTHAAAFTELRAAQWKAEPRALNAARRHGILKLIDPLSAFNLFCTTNKRTFSCEPALNKTTSRGAEGQREEGQMDFEGRTPVLSGRESERTEVRVLDSRGTREKVRRTSRMKSAVWRIKRNVQFRKERTEPVASGRSAVQGSCQRRQET